MVPSFKTPISAATRLCAVFGHPIRHSGSPAMQNAAIAALGLNWRYVAFEVTPDELAGALAGAKFMRFVGVNLTVPHKLLAMTLVDALDVSARTWGAVNTVRFEGQDGAGNWKPLCEFDSAPAFLRSHGFNTDADAITRSLQDDLGVTVAGAKVLVLGAGGAGRTAALKLASEGVAELFLVNRTQDKADAVAADIRQRYPEVNVGVGYPGGAVHLVVNATSLGLRPEDPLPFDPARFDLARAGAVYDMIYSPVETPLLKLAEAAGCHTANGVGMLVYQGARALELWTGLAAPVAVMRRALEAHLYGT